MKQGGQYYWYQNDHIGTPQKLTTTSGAVVWSAKYSSFGKAAIDSSSTVVNPLRFPGQYEDVETGLHYNWFRYYDTNSGRYFVTDPIGLYGGLNSYRYSSNSPINAIDPWGLFAVIVFNRRGNSGTLTVTDSSSNSITVTAYDSGPGPTGNRNGPPYQIPAGTYKVTRRTVGIVNGVYHDGRPTLSNTNVWYEVVTPNGRRTHIQLHGGTGPHNSAGCIVSPEIDQIRRIIDDEYDKGGVTIIINDVIQGL